MLNHPEKYDWSRALLHKLGGIYPDVVLAGGALRDMFLTNTEPKDFDFFTATEVGTEALTEWLKTNFGTDFVAREAHSPEFIQRYVEFFSKQLVRVVTVDGFASPVQLIQTKFADANELIRDFDWSFCQCAVAANGDGWSTDAADRAVAVKIAELVISPSDPRLERSLQRGRGFSKRFPEWKFVVPLELLGRPDGIFAL